MICRSAGYDIHFIEILDLFFCHTNTVENDISLFIHPSGNRISNSLRLLVNFLEHKMIVSFFFRGIRIPCHIEYLAVDLPALRIVNLDAARRKNDSFVIFDKIDFSHML